MALDDGASEVTVQGGESQGAVAVVAIDEDDRVALVNQYRHPVREHLWELPAGLRDVEGEPAAETAARELAEETDMRAGTIEPLIELYSSPGCSDEWIPVFLPVGTRVLDETAPKRPVQQSFGENQTT